MTQEEIDRLLGVLERIAVALEPRQRPMNPRSPAVEDLIRKVVKDELKKQP